VNVVDEIGLLVVGIMTAFQILSNASNVGMNTISDISEV
jgi:hypothetical protein